MPHAGRQLTLLLAKLVLLAQPPEVMQPRYLQTMTPVAGDRASTIVRPLPMDMLAALALARMSN